MDSGSPPQTATSTELGYSPPAGGQNETRPDHGMMMLTHSIWLIQITWSVGEVYTTDRAVHRKHGFVHKLLCSTFPDTHEGDRTVTLLRSISGVQGLLLSKREYLFFSF